MSTPEQSGVSIIPENLAFRIHPSTNIAIQHKNRTMALAAKTSEILIQTHRNTILTLSAAENGHPDVDPWALPTGAEWWTDEM